jgi:hypothetical protein
MHITFYDEQACLLRTFAVMSTLSQRIRTWSARHPEEVKPPFESYVGKEQNKPQLVHDVQSEATQQSKNFDAQIHKMKVCSAACCGSFNASWWSAPERTSVLRQSSFLVPSWNPTYVTYILSPEI